MNRFSAVLLFSLAFLALPAALYAQTGCGAGSESLSCEPCGDCFACVNFEYGGCSGTCVFDSSYCASEPYFGKGSVAARDSVLDKAALITGLVLLAAVVWLVTDFFKTPGRRKK